MPELNEQTLTSLRDELHKMGASLGGNVGSMLGAGAALGAGLGGLIGGKKEYDAARGQGGGVVESALHGLHGGVGGALAGGLGGAALGGAVGAAGSYLAPKMTSSFASRLSSGSLGAAGRWGQRQVHGVTGWKPEGGLGEIGIGGSAAKDNAQRMEERLHSLVDNGGSARDIRSAADQLRRSNRAIPAAEEVERRGMTSIPGALQSLKKDWKGTLAAGIKNQWNGASRGEKAFMVGMPALDLASSLTSDDDSHRGERIGRNVAGLASGALLGGVPMVTGQLGGMALGTLGSLAGKGVDRLRAPGLVNRKPELEPADNTSHVPTERVMSASAMGQAPEAG